MTCSGELWHSRVPSPSRPAGGREQGTADGNTEPEHTPRTTASTRLLQEPSLGPVTSKGGETQSAGALVCGEAAATHPHPPSLAHLGGTVGKQGQEGSGNRQWKAQALFCEAGISYHYPPCPRQTLPVRWKPPERGTHHRPPAPSRSPAGPPRSWAGRGRAAAVSRDLPACPAAPIPPTRPPQPQHSAGSIPVFIQHKHQRIFFLFQTAFKGFRDYVHRAQKITQTSLGRKKAASATVWRGSRFSRRVGIRPPARVGSARGC